MKVLLLGVGMQGKAALHDLVNSQHVSEIVAADYELDMLEKFVQDKKYEKVTCKYLDATDENQLHQMIADKADIIIDLLPVPFVDTVATLAVKNNCHLVNTFYATPGVQALQEEAFKKNITILPELGLDPGIDLVLLGKALQFFDEINVIKSYGGGIPEKSAIDNPLKYKVTWNFEGVLRAYKRTGYIINEGKVEEINEREIFNPENIHTVDVKELGKMEAYPNGDAAKYVDILGLDRSKFDLAGRYALRWPGHCQFWKSIVDLHFLDDDPVNLDDMEINRCKYFAKVVESSLQLKKDQRDIAIVRLEVEGIKDNKKRKCLYQVIDYRDLTTGLTGMSRTVGFPASIGAQLVGIGKIRKRGLLSPVTDVPYNLFIEELEKRNIQVTELVD